MTASNTVPAADRRRAATLLLATLGDTPGEALDAVFAEGGYPAVMGVTSALVAGMLELLVAATNGNVDAVREHLELQVLNAEMDE